MGTQYAIACPRGPGRPAGGHKTGTGGALALSMRGAKRARPAGAVRISPALRPGPRALRARGVPTHEPGGRGGEPLWPGGGGSAE